MEDPHPVEAEGYVLVGHPERPGAEGELKQRRPVEKREEMPDAPATPPAKAHKSTQTTDKPNSAVELVSAVLCWLVAGIEAVAQRVRTAAPHALASLRSAATSAAAATQQCAQLVRAGDFTSLKQLAAGHVSAAAAQLASLVGTAAAALQPAGASLRAWAQSAAAAAAFCFHNPGDAWRSSASACCALYLRLDPQKKLLAAGSSVSHFAAALYARIDPSGRGVERVLGFYQSRVAPALSHAAAAASVAAHKAQPWLVAAWERAAPSAAGLWAHAEQAWRGPGMPRVLLLGGAVAAFGWAVALWCGL